MKKAVYLLLLVLGVFLTGCKGEKEEVDGKAAASKTESSKMEEVDTTLEPTIEIKEYKKIIVLDPAAVETIYKIGGEDHIEAIAVTEMTPIWPVEKTKELKSVGTMLKPSIEQIVSLSPDLVVLNYMSTNMGSKLEELGIPYMVNKGNSIEDIIDNIELYGKLTNSSEKASELVKEYRETLAKLKESVKDDKLELKGVFLYSTSPLMAFTKDTLPGEIMNIFGIENLADGVTGDRPILSSEYMIMEDPNIILGAQGMSKKEDVLKANPYLLDTRAGKTGNIHTVDSAKVLRATPRLIETLDELYESIKDGSLE